jgi:hypothetical protein
MDELTLKLSVSEINAILGLMGDAPTRLGFYPLLLKIQQQAQNQPPAVVAEIPKE